MVGIDEMTKKTTTKKKKDKKEPTATQPHAEQKTQVPPRATTEPIVAKQATPDVKKRFAEIYTPRYGAEELAGLKLAHDFVQELKTKAGFSIEGTRIRRFELDYLNKITIVALQRSQLVNDLEFKIKELTEKVAELEEKAI